MGNSKDRYAQLATAIFVETGWELHPAEVRDNEEFQATLEVDAWLRDGRTDQFETTL